MTYCPFNACKTLVPDGTFCCRRHWKPLAASSQQLVLAAYAKGLTPRALALLRLKVVAAAPPLPLREAA